MFVVIHVGINLIVDISYGYLNPRVRVVVTTTSLRSRRSTSRDPGQQPAADAEDAGIGSTRSSVAARGPTPAARLRRSCARSRRHRAGVPPPAPVRDAGLRVTCGRTLRTRPRLARPRARRCGDHSLGTDQPRARHLQPRLSTARGVSLRSGFQIVVLALAVAVPLGLLAGFRGGGTDNTLMRIMDAILLDPRRWCSRSRSSACSAPGSRTRCSPSDDRDHPGLPAPDPRADAGGARGDVHRGVAVDRGRDPGGSRRTRVLPNVASPLIVQASLALGSALIAEAALSFLGFGVQPPQRELGRR